MINITRESILEHTRYNWDNKDKSSKFKTSKKYKHILNKNADWNLPFGLLSSEQQVILLKGELIRTYDNLPNIIKTKLKRTLNLSEFSSKWYKLPSVDKLVLLRTYVL